MRHARYLANINDESTPPLGYLRLEVKSTTVRVRSSDGLAVVLAQPETFIEPRTSDPTSPITGQMWIRTDL